MPTHVCVHHECGQMTLPDPMGSPVAAEASVMFANCEPDMPDSRILAPACVELCVTAITITSLCFTFLPSFMRQNTYQQHVCSNPLRALSVPGVEPLLFAGRMMSCRSPKAVPFNACRDTRMCTTDTVADASVSGSTSALITREKSRCMAEY